TPLLLQARAVAFLSDLKDRARAIGKSPPAERCDNKYAFEEDDGLEPRRRKLETNKGEDQGKVRRTYGGRPHPHRGQTRPARRQDSRTLRDRQGSGTQ